MKVDTDTQGGVHMSLVGRVRATGVGRASGDQYSINTVFGSNLEATGAGPWTFTTYTRSYFIGQGSMPNQDFELTPREG